MEPNRTLVVEKNILTNNQIENTFDIELKYDNSWKQDRKRLTKIHLKKSRLEVPESTLDGATLTTRFCEERIQGATKVKTFNFFKSQQSSAQWWAKIAPPTTSEIFKARKWIESMQHLVFEEVNFNEQLKKRHQFSKKFEIIRKSDNEQTFSLLSKNAISNWINQGCTQFDN